LDITNDNLVKISKPDSKPRRFKHFNLLVFKVDRCCHGHRQCVYVL